MIGYHVTTTKKLNRYQQSHLILPPVRFWRYKKSAEEWARKCNRTVILQISVGKAYPLPDHKPRGHAYWTPEHVRSWKEVIHVR